MLDERQGERGAEPPTRAKEETATASGFFRIARRTNAQILRRFSQPQNRELKREKNRGGKRIERERGGERGRERDPTDFRIFVILQHVVSHGFARENAPDKEETNKPLVTVTINPDGPSLKHINIQR